MIKKLRIELSNGKRTTLDKVWTSEYYVYGNNIFINTGEYVGKFLNSKNWRMRPCNGWSTWDTWITSLHFDEWDYRDYKNGVNFGTIFNRVVTRMLDTEFSYRITRHHVNIKELYQFFVGE